MSGDRRTVATDALATLGTILDEHQKRDAIHLAVEPVVAGEFLHPGNHITIRDGQAFQAAVGEGLGIVDPFIQVPVRKGQRFWFVMYPRKITSLRHVWAHPAFPDEPGTPGPAVPTRDQKAASVSWLRQYAARVNHYMGAEEAYETLLRHIREKAITYQGTDMHGFGDLQDADELKYHAEIVLEEPVNWNEFEYFSCTC